MSWSETLEKIQTFDINDLDYDTIGSWPLPVRVIIYVVTLLLVLGLGYQFYLTNLWTAYDQAYAREMQLKETYNLKAFQAANLSAYRSQMQIMERSFADLVQKLPSDTEVPGLLDDITAMGQQSNLLIQEIKLQDEKITQFYIELPISIVVKGSYHNLGKFVSGVANLSRIVTLHDFAIEPDRNGLLEMKILAKTYRYNEQGGM